MRSLWVTDLLQVVLKGTTPLIHSLKPARKSAAAWKAKACSLSTCLTLQDQHKLSSMERKYLAFWCIWGCPSLLCPSLSTSTWHPEVGCLQAGVPSSVSIPQLRSQPRQPRAAVLWQQHRPAGATWGTDATKSKRAEGLTQQLLSRSSQKQLGNACFEGSEMQFLPNREGDKTIPTMCRI